jgi:hypothetical protein
MIQEKVKVKIFWHYSFKDKHHHRFRIGYDNLAEAGKKKKDRQKMPFEVGHGLRYIESIFKTVF